jgi:acyl dehydratase
MPHSSSVGPDCPAPLSLSHAVRCEADEVRALSHFLGLPENATPLILPMLWLGKSELPFAMRAIAGDQHFAVQEAQDFFYHRPLSADESGTLSITLTHDTSETPQRVLIAAHFTSADGSTPVTLKTTIRLIEKPSGSETVSASAPKQRASASIDHPLPRIDQTMIDRYAQLSGDDNPVHLDRAVAQSLGLPDTIAHGMILLGLAQQGFSTLHQARDHAAFPLHLSGRFLLPVHAGQKTGLSIKQQSHDDTVSERVTLSSDAGPHLLATIRYCVQPST